jgi:hypothetical protein
MARSEEEAFQAQFAILQAQSDLNDARETSRVAAVLKSTSDRLAAAHEFIEATLLRGLGLEASGSDLDDVVAQWPDFEPRGQASYAQGAVLTMTRDSSVGELVVPAGSVFATQSGQKAVLLADAVFLDGQTTFPALGQARGYVSSTTPGPAGRIDAGALRVVVRAPTGVVSCNNPVALSGGQEAETDAQLRSRFLDYLAGGITRMPERGLVALAKSFRSEGVRHASVWVDPARPYAELRIDDGRGFAGLTQPAKKTQGVVPVNGQLDFWVDGPVVDSEVVLRVNGSPVSPVRWTLIHERGRAWLDEGASIWSPGDTWEVYGHQVYVGVIAKLQRVIEGLQAWAARQWGYRSVASRVRVVPVQVELVEYNLLVVYEDGVDRDSVDATIRDVLVAFHDDLEADQPLLMLRVSAALDKIPGVRNINLRDRDDISVDMRDVYPTPGFKLGTMTGLIRINRS